jgi:hypothetical protein
MSATYGFFMFRVTQGKNFQFAVYQSSAQKRHNAEFWTQANLNIQIAAFQIT